MSRVRISSVNRRYVGGDNRESELRQVGYFRRVEDITTKAEWRRRRRFYLAVLIEGTFAPR